MFLVRFLPEDRSFTADAPLELFLAAAACDIWLEQPCGTKTICGKCRVRMLEGAPEPTLADARLLTGAELDEGWRLGCQVVLDRAAVIEIPPVTRSVAAKTFGPADMFAAGLTPNFCTAALDVPPPDEDNQFAELDLLARAAGVPAFAAPLPLARQVPAILREAEYQVAAVWEEVPGPRSQVPSHAKLLAVSAGNQPEPIYGVAVDLGSTTLAAALVDLVTGDVVRTLSRLNPQVKFGGDIISRIHFAQEHPDGNQQLHAVLLEAVGGMLGELASQAGVSSECIYALSFAGNPTMLHSALGVDITPLGHAPYVGLWTREWTVRACELGLPAHPNAVARFLPMIRSHVGADTVAGILATGMDRARGWRLLIDLGTNSEVVLGCAERLVATSTAAGPAFEGANIYHGMRAAPGAIDAVRVTPDGRVVVKTVANEPPRGICGSGLIDAAAELVRVGMIAPSGYMRGRDELAHLPASLAERVIRLPDGQRAVRLAGDVVLTAQDVRQLQLIKGSIYAGIDILTRHFGIPVDDLEEVSVAGAFGNFIRKSSAQAIGLVPAIDPEHIHFVGNAAGAGARMVLVDAEARQRARQVAARCEYVELGGHPDYQDAFCAAIPFPQTNGTQINLDQKPEPKAGTADCADSADMQAGRRSADSGRNRRRTRMDADAER